MRRRTLEEKLEAIHQIYEWLYIYKEKGVSGLENKRICKKNQYSFQEHYEKITLFLPFPLADSKKMLIFAAVIQNMTYGK